jgi:hypothetical protein
VTAEHQPNEDRYGVFEVETDDLVPCSESGRPNIATFLTVSAPQEKFEGRIAGTSGLERIRGHVLALRPILGLTKRYPTLQPARMAERLLITRLLRQGHIVNRRSRRRRVCVAELHGSHLATPPRVHLQEERRPSTQRSDGWRSGNFSTTNVIWHLEHIWRSYCRRSRVMTW